MGKLNDLYNLEDSSARATNDFRRATLVADGVAPGTLNDMEFRKLRSLGYTGTLDDMWVAYVADSGGGDGLVDVFDSTFYGGGVTPGTENIQAAQVSKLTFLRAPADTIRSAQVTKLVFLRAP